MGGRRRRSATLRSRKHKISSSLARSSTARYSSTSFWVALSSSMSILILSSADGGGDASLFSLPAADRLSIASIDKLATDKLATAAGWSTGIILTSATAERFRNLQRYPASLLRRRMAA